MNLPLFCPPYVGTRHGDQAWEPGTENRSGNQAWEPDVGSRRGNQMWEPGAGSRRGNQAREPGVGTRCGEQVWEAAAKRPGRGWNRPRSPTVSGLDKVDGREEKPPGRRSPAVKRHTARPVMMGSRLRNARLPNSPAANAQSAVPSKSVETGSPNLLNSLI